MKGLNSGTEAVVTVDLILTVQKPLLGDVVGEAQSSKFIDTTTLIQEAISDLPPEKAGNPSYVYAHVLTKAIQKHLSLDDLHLSDVLIALRKAGYSIDQKSGFLLKNNLSREAA